MKAQIAMEYLFIVGLMLFVVSIAFFYAQNTSTDTIKLEQAKDAVRSIASTADRIAGIGPQTKTAISVTIPEGSSNLTISGKSAQLTVALSGGPTDVFEIAEVNITTNETLGPGTYELVLEVGSDGVVSVSKAP
jgi:uncharacterized protein (UPF0333 family)